MSQMKFSCDRCAAFRAAKLDADIAAATAALHAAADSDRKSLQATVDPVGGLFVSLLKEFGFPLPPCASKPTEGMKPDYHGDLLVFGSFAINPYAIKLIVDNDVYVETSSGNVLCVRMTEESSQAVREHLARRNLPRE